VAIVAVLHVLRPDVSPVGVAAWMTRSSLLALAAIGALSERSGSRQSVGAASGRHKPF